MSEMQQRFDHINHSLSEIKHRLDRIERNLATLTDYLVRAMGKEDQTVDVPEPIRFGVRVS